MRVSHSPLWGDRAAKATGLWALLFAPLLLWEALFYRPRINITTRKTRPADWPKLQGQQRFFDALFCYLGPPSHFLWNVKAPLALTMAVATGMCLYGFARTELGWDLPALDRSSVSYIARLASFPLSLLLSLRVGRSYDRWWVARLGFAGVGNAATALVQQAAAWVDAPALQADIRRWAVVWHYSVLQVVQGDAALHPAAAALLSREELALYSSSRKGRQLVASQLRLLVREAGVGRELVAAMDLTIGKGWSDAGNCVRLRFQAMPAGLSLISTGFLFIWLMLLPFGMWQEDNTSWFSLLGVFFVALLLLSVDEIATQLENPFPLLPLEEMMESTVQDSQRALEDAAALLRLRQRCKEGADDSDGSAKAGSFVAVGIDGTQP